MKTITRLTTGLLSLVVASAVIAGLPVAPGVPTPTASAAEASQFNPAQIVSDAVFYDSDSMSVADVQSFLNQRGANCVAGEQPCLKDIRTDSRTWAAEANLCAGYTGRAQESAAEIIVGVARSCGISPKALLVLLEKEQALVGRTRPTSRAYQIAMGFGCPDTAPCNAEYYGFFNQTYRAARQFQVYRNFPTRYGYQAGRSNYVQWHPNAACGGTNLVIENQATAALYIYTPYQPNAAAMRNLYGTGDSCSSYGNRNFWRIFTDWFGDPRHASAFVRTASDATVWLVNGANRHRVPSLDVLESYSRLGGVAVVSGSYLNQLAVGPDLGSVVLDPASGNVLFVNANIGLRMTSCAQVADFGASCSTLPSLSAAQVRSLSVGPTMTNGYESTDGRRWYVSGGQRREVFDTASLTANGLPTSTVRLTFSGIAALPVGTPVLRDGVVVEERWTSTAWVWVDGRRHEVPIAAVRSQSTLASLPRAVLDGAGIATLPPGFHLTGVVQEAGGGRFLMTTTGLARLSDAATTTSTAPVFSAAFVSRFPAQPAVPVVAYVRDAGSSTVVRVERAQARPLATWADLQASAGTPSPVVHVVPEGLGAKLATPGPAVVAPGLLVRTAESAAVFYATDVNAVVQVDDLAVPRELGATTVRTVSRESLAATSVAAGYLSPVVRCGTTSFVAQGGTLVPADVSGQRGMPTTTLGTWVCGSLTRTTAAATTPVLVRTAHSPDVHLVSGGVRQHVLTWSAAVRLSGGRTPTIATVGTPTLLTIPVGAPIS